MKKITILLFFTLAVISAQANANTQSIKGTIVAFDACDSILATNYVYIIFNESATSKEYRLLVPVVSSNIESVEKQSELYKQLITAQQNSSEIEIKTEFIEALNYCEIAFDKKVISIMP